MPKFINTELKSDSESSDSDLDSEKVGSKFDNELMAKLEKSASDSEQNINKFSPCVFVDFEQIILLLVTY